MIYLHVGEYTNPVVLIYINICKGGWWGETRTTKVRLEESPFIFGVNTFLKKSFIQIPVVDCPCSVYVEQESVSLFEHLILDIETIGMYSALKLSSWTCEMKNICKPC